MVVKCPNCPCGVAVPWHAHPFISTVPGHPKCVTYRVDISIVSPTPFMLLQDYLPPALHSNLLAAATEFLWLPWKEAMQHTVEGATQGGSQVGGLVIRHLQAGEVIILSICSATGISLPFGVHFRSKLVSIHTHGNVPCRRFGMPRSRRKHKRAGSKRRLVATLPRSCCIRYPAIAVLNPQCLRTPCLADSRLRLVCM